VLVIEDNVIHKRVVYYASVFFYILCLLICRYLFILEQHYFNFVITKYMYIDTLCSQRNQ
jgi:hypothetical protein